MRSVTTWSDRVPDRDGTKSVANDICFKPDGTQPVAAIGNRVQRLLFCLCEQKHFIKSTLPNMFAHSFAPPERPQKPPRATPKPPKARSLPENSPAQSLPTTSQTRQPPRCPAWFASDQNA